MSHVVASVGKRAPAFDLPCTHGRGSVSGRVTLEGLRDRWVVLVFYPRDFSLVCPTELTALGGRIEEFRRRDCDLVGISTDSIESHERWLATPRAQGGLGEIPFPLASDQDGSVSRAYGVYLDRQHVALRGLFIIDPNGVLQYQAVHNLSVGRRSEEVLRILDALGTGGMCPEDWRPGTPTLEPADSLGPGSVVSHYRIESRLGAGSFAVVFRARDIVLERTVALKVFKPDRLPSPAVALAEARAAAALSHPNVCTVFAVDDSEGVPIISMEFVDGQSLHTLLEGGALRPNDAAHVARQIASGIAAAHELGIVHRDLKPANILITNDRTAKITDFGLSRRAAPDHDPEATQSFRDLGSIIGTPRYMSPEQARGEVATAASDVFAFGAVLYEMLTGQKAFDGQSTLEVLQQILATSPDRFAQQLEPPFDEITRRALALDPAQRSIAMHEIADQLQDLVRHRTETSI